jgi:hypothetical protein
MFVTLKPSSSSHDDLHQESHHHHHEQEKRNYQEVYFFNIFRLKKDTKIDSSFDILSSSLNFNHHHHSSKTLHLK